MQFQQDQDLQEITASGLGLPTRYTVMAAIGRGGMGCIYKAQDSELNVEVAIKLLHEDLCTTVEGHQRFLREARALASLTHENIIGIRQMGISEQGRPFQVVDLLDGETLGDRLLRTGPLAIAEFCHIFAQIADALEYSSSKNIIHRDIKPSNIFLCGGEPDKEKVKAVLLDFGIAKIIQEDDDPEKTVTATAFVVGSPLYMSPEQCRGSRVDHCSDMYSLGCVMYESLAGNPPLRGESHMETMYMHMNHPVPQLQALTRSGNQGTSMLAEVIGQCLSKDPQKRPRSFAELKQCLMGVSPDSRALRFIVSPDTPKKKKVNPRILAGSCLALLIIVIAVFWWKHGRDELCFGTNRTSADSLAKLTQKVRIAKQRYQTAVDENRDSLASVLREDLPTLANCYAAVHQYDDAEAMLKEIFPLCSNLPDKHFRRARIWQQLFDISLKRFSRAPDSQREHWLEHADDYIRNAIQESEENELNHAACESHLRRVRLLCEWKRIAQSQADFDRFITQLHQLTVPLSVSNLEGFRPHDRRLHDPETFVRDTIRFQQNATNKELLVLCDHCTRIGEFFISIGHFELIPLTLRRAKACLTRALALGISEKSDEYQTRIARVKQLETSTKVRSAL